MDIWLSCRMQLVTTFTLVLITIQFTDLDMARAQNVLAKNDQTIPEEVGIAKTEGEMANTDVSLVKNESSETKIDGMGQTEQGVNKNNSTIKKVAGKAKGNGNTQMSSEVLQQIRLELLDLFKELTPLATSSNDICQKTIPEGTQYGNQPYNPANPNKFSPTHLLEDFCDDPGTVKNFNRWKPPERTVGASAYAILDLGCTQQLSQILVRNCGNGFYKDRGTKDFVISLAREQNPNHWIPIIRDRLPDVRNVACKNQEGPSNYQITPTLARYVRIEVLSYYGERGACLNFLDAN